MNDKEFERLFKELFKPLTAHALKYLKDVDDAKEIVHQAFIKLWETRQTIDMNQNVRAYLYMTVTNLSLNYIRDNKKFVSTEEVFDWNVRPESFEDLAEKNELTEALIAAVDSLPPKMRQIFVLSRFDGLSHKEIAQKLGISVKTVENQIGRALKKLRKSLANFV